MNKTLATIGIGIGLVSGGVLIDGMIVTVAEVKTDADARIELALPSLKDEQDAYFLKNGAYEQKRDVIVDDTYSTRVDVYDSPKGKGYVVVSSFTKGDTVYSKAENFGPEEYRSHDWKAQVIPSL